MARKCFLFVAVTSYKVTLVGALGLIGGTMGLFTGFSILSGIEILYFVAKFFFSLRFKKREYQKKSENQSIYWAWKDWLVFSISYMCTCYVSTSMCFVINPKILKIAPWKKKYFVFGQAHTFNIPMFMSRQYICEYKGSFEVNWNSPWHCPGWQNYLQKRGHKG